MQTNAQVSLLKGLRVEAWCHVEVAGPYNTPVALSDRPKELKYLPIVIDAHRRIVFSRPLRSVHLYNHVQVKRSRQIY